MTLRRAAHLITALALSAAVLAVVLVSSPWSGPPSPTIRASAPPVPSTPVPSVTPDEEVVQEIARDTVTGPSGSERDTAVEPYVAVDPSRPEVAVAAFQLGRFPDGGAAAIGFATSHDGGRTWTSGVIPGLTRASGGPYGRASDPSVGFGPDGSVYVSSIVLRGPGGQWGIAVNRSDEGGLSWNEPVFLERDPAGTNDFPRVAVDAGAASPTEGRVYVTYVRRGRAVLRWSDDRAATWSSIRTVSPGPGFVPNVLVGPDGTLTVVYITRTGRESPRLVSRTSRDGSRSFRPQVDIGEMRIESSRGLRATGVEGTTVDPISGTLYAVWQDEREGDDVNDVVLARSLDRGATWTRPTRVNPDGSDDGLDHLLPTVAARDGQVRVVYMTRPTSGGRPSSMLRLRVIGSEDSGVTFEGERTIGPLADIRYAAEVRPGRTRFLGDYIGVALTPDSLLVVWSRSYPPSGVEGYHTTIWAATIPEAA